MQGCGLGDVCDARRHGRSCELERLQLQRPPPQRQPWQADAHWRAAERAGAGHAHAGADQGGDREDGGLGDVRRVRGRHIWPWWPLARPARRALQGQPAARLRHGPGGHQGGRGTRQGGQPLHNPPRAVFLDGGGISARRAAGPLGRLPRPRHLLAAVRRGPPRLPARGRRAARLALRPDQGRAGVEVPRERAARGADSRAARVRRDDRSYRGAPDRRRHLPRALRWHAAEAHPRVRHAGSRCQGHRVPADAPVEAGLPGASHPPE
mmetsp:Transcript_79118/g.203790  ORF Transcript_79118/g.203790 Transcript_79118/m.203790 type:complete len:266 (-) Transcript_79118:92-889(-)